MASFGVAEQAGRLFTRLSAGKPARVLVVSDSTAAGKGCWPDLLTHWSAGRYPRLRTQFVQWNKESECYDPPEERQPGSKARANGPPPALAVYNLSVGGKTTDYALGCLAKGVTAVAPDLIFVAHGLNEASATNPPPDRDQYRAQYLALTESLAATAPQAGMVLVLQNPETTSSVMSERNREYTRVARLRRCGLVDVHGAFLAHPNWETGLMRDARHPNEAGQQLWADEVQRALDRTGAIVADGRRRSTLLPTRGRQLLSHGRVAQWKRAPPAGWSLHNAALALGGHIRGLAPEQPSYLEARIMGAGLEAVRGKPISVAARVLLPEAHAGGTSGLLEIDDHRERSLGGSYVQRSRVATLRAGCFVWVCATRIVHPCSPAVTVRLYATLGDDGPAEMIVDRITAVPGVLPRNRIDDPE